MIEPKIEGLLSYTRYAPDQAPDSAGEGPSVPLSVPQSTFTGTLVFEAAQEATQISTGCKTVVKPVLSIVSGTVDSPIKLDHGTKLVPGDCVDHGANASSDGDACSSITDRAQSGRLGRREAQGRAFCKGILVEFPWDYRSTRDKFYIQAKQCRKPLISKGSACKDCQVLTSMPLYINIMDRIQCGVHESTPLVYHGVGGLVEVTRRKTEQVRQL